MEEKVTADLTDAERAQLQSTLAKIHRSASALLGDESASGDHIAN
jgi:hypothetical protein